MGIPEKYPSYDIPVDDIFSLIRDRGYRHVLLQIPEGLKRGSAELAEIIEKGTGASVWIDGEPCYGACDHAGERAAVLDTDAVMHLGHSGIPSMDMSHSVPVHFFPIKMREDPEKMLRGLEDLLDGLNLPTIGLATTVQHGHLLGPASDLIENRGIKVLIGQPGIREEAAGQVLGCSFHTAREVAAEAEGYIFIGTGRFHALGLYLSVRKPVWMVDPSDGTVSAIDPVEMDRFLKRRFAAITRGREIIKERGRVGIVIGYKPGQRRIELSSELRNILKDQDVDSTMIAMEHMDPMKIRSLGFGLICSTACPRIAVDDSDRYLAEGITLLTPGELRIALGIDDWEDYELDEQW
ncbi:MAG: diphthamide biosynthesis enzyme Dph2 [Thermoplasmatota archaeon]